jgi:hypothetical protein
MAWQLVYTSSPKLLQAGRTGFGTVAAHPSIRPALREQIEQISKFSRIDGLNPKRIIYSNRTFSAGGEFYSVISRIRDCGADYTGRTNHIAHHIVVPGHEVGRARNISPFDLIFEMEASNRWFNHWEGAPQELGEGELVDLAGIPARLTLPAAHWASHFGQAALASSLAPRGHQEPCWIFYPESLSAELLSLLGESALLHPNPWLITFSSDLQPTDSPDDVQWRAVSAGSPLRANAERSHRTIIDLGNPASLSSLPEYARLAEYGLVQEITPSGIHLPAAGTSRPHIPGLQHENVPAEIQVEESGSTGPSLAALRKKKESIFYQPPPRPKPRWIVPAALAIVALLLIAGGLAGFLNVQSSREKATLESNIASAAERLHIKNPGEISNLALPNKSLKTLLEFLNGLPDTPNNPEDEAEQLRARLMETANTQEGLPAGLINWINDLGRARELAVQQARGKEAGILVKEGKFDEAKKVLEIRETDANGTDLLKLPEDRPGMGENESALLDAWIALQELPVDKPKTIDEASDLRDKIDKITAEIPGDNSQEPGPAYAEIDEKLVQLLEYTLQMPEGQDEIWKKMEAIATKPSHNLDLRQFNSAADSRVKLTEDLKSDEKKTWNDVKWRAESALVFYQEKSQPTPQVTTKPPKKEKSEKHTKSLTLQITEDLVAEAKKSKPTSESNPTFGILSDADLQKVLQGEVPSSQSPSPTPESFLTRSLENKKGIYYEREGEYVYLILDKKEHFKVDVSRSELMPDVDLEERKIKIPAALVNVFDQISGEEGSGRNPNLQTNYRDLIKSGDPNAGDLEIRREGEHLLLLLPDRIGELQGKINSNTKEKKKIDNKIREKWEEFRKIWNNSEIGSQVPEQPVRLKGKDLFAELIAKIKEKTSELNDGKEKNDEWKPLNDLYNSLRNDFEKLPFQKSSLINNLKKALEELNIPNIEPSPEANGKKVPEHENKKLIDAAVFFLVEYPGLHDKSRKYQENISKFKQSIDGIQEAEKSLLPNFELTILRGGSPFVTYKFQPGGSQ